MPIGAQEEASASLSNNFDMLKRFTTDFNNFSRDETAEGQIPVPSNLYSYSSTGTMQTLVDPALPHGSLIDPQTYSPCHSQPVKRSFPLWAPTEPNIWSNTVIRSGYVSSPPPATGNTSVLEQNISPNYRGNHMAAMNLSADIPTDLNTSVWITNLPPHCTYNDLLSMIRDTGKVVSDSHRYNILLRVPIIRATNTFCYVRPS